MSDIHCKHRLLGVAALLVVVTSWSLAETAQAAYCKQGLVEARGKHWDHNKALQHGWANWQKKVADFYGLPWSNTSIATLKSQNCNYPGYCIVKARPCLHIP